MFKIFSIVLFIFLFLMGAMFFYIVTPSTSTFVFEVGCVDEGQYYTYQKGEIPRPNSQCYLCGELLNDGWHDIKEVLDGASTNS